LTCLSFELVMTLGTQMHYAGAEKYGFWRQIFGQKFLFLQKFILKDATALLCRFGQFGHFRPKIKRNVTLKQEP
jgi:hypothetical protein